MRFDPESGHTLSPGGSADRVGVKTLQDGHKVRVFKDNGEQVDA